MFRRARALQPTAVRRQHTCRQMFGIIVNCNPSMHFLAVRTLMDAFFNLIALRGMSPYVFDDILIVLPPSCIRDYFHTVAASSHRFAAVMRARCILHSCCKFSSLCRRYACTIPLTQLLQVCLLSPRSRDQSPLLDCVCLTTQSRRNSKS